MKILLVGLAKLGSEYGGGQVYVQSFVNGFLAKKQEIAYVSIVVAAIKAPENVWLDYKTIKEL